MNDPKLAMERARILKLAKAGVKTTAIVERLGMTYGRVRRMVLRAETRGDVPAGTLARCCVMKRAQK